MTLKNLFLYSFLQWLFFILLKVAFLNYEILSNSGWQNILFWLLAAAVAAAFSRRFGILNYLEAIFLIIVWSLGNLLLDLLVLTAYTGTGVFLKMEFWVSYAMFALSIFLFHKKRHIHVRKLLHHSHHGHH